MTVQGMRPLANGLAAAIGAVLVAGSGPFAPAMGDPASTPAGPEQVRIEAASVHWRTGRPANLTYAYQGSMSDDATRVLMVSRATTLIPGPPNEGSHIYLRDLAAGTTTLVNTDNSGQPVTGHRGPGRAAISGDGRYAAFTWDEDRLSPTGENAGKYVFVKNLDTGRLDANRIWASGSTSDTRIWLVSVKATSQNGRYVAGTAHFFPHVDGLDAPFLLDRRTDRLHWVNPVTDGANVYSISPDGRYVAYNHSGGIGNAQHLRFDRRTGQSTVIPNGGLPESFHPMTDVSFSGNGRFMAASWHSYNHDRERHLIYRTADMAIVQRLHDMVIQDLSHSGRYLAVSANPNGTRWYEVYRYDRHQGTFTRMSVTIDDRPLDGHSWATAISGDGRTIAIASSASNLVAGDMPSDGEYGDTYDAFVAAIGPCRGRLCLPDE